MSETVEPSFLLEVISEYMHNMLLNKKDGEIMPTWLCVTREGQKLMLATPWRDDQEKEDQVARVRVFMKLKNVVCYAFVDEMWMAHVTKEEFEDPHTQRPKDRVDRIEIVMAFATNNQECVYRQWDIKRNYEGTVIELPEKPLVSKDGEEGQFSSWLTQLLK